MKTPKLVSISLFGLGINALFNGAFVLLIARVSDSALLAQSMVMWSGFFIAGACIAPFENYFLYRRLEGSDQYSRVKVLLLSGSLFLIMGIPISFTQSISLWVLPLTLLVGLCVGQIVCLRSEAIYQEELARVSVANMTEGLARAVSLLVFTTQFERTTLWHILISYVVGNLVSILPYLKLQKVNQSKTRPTLSAKKVYGFAAIGLFAALITGGLPYIAGFFEVGTISTILFFFTISRSLLIFQSVLVYVNPHWAKDLGDEISMMKLIKYLLASLAPTFLLLTIVKNGVQLILNIDLSLIKHDDTLYFSLALVVSAYFNLKIASQNATNQWLSALTAGILGFSTACLAFLIVDPIVNSFYGAMVFAPLIGILFLVHFTKSRETTE
jgi:hypothetical protein